MTISDVTTRSVGFVLCVCSMWTLSKEPLLLIGFLLCQTKAGSEESCLAFWRNLFYIFFNVAFLLTVFFFLKLGNNEIWLSLQISSEASVSHFVCWVQSVSRAGYVKGLGKLWSNVQIRCVGTSSIRVWWPRSDTVHVSFLSWANNGLKSRCRWSELGNWDIDGVRLRGIWESRFNITYVVFNWIFKRVRTSLTAKDWQRIGRAANQVWFAQGQQGFKTIFWPPLRSHESPVSFCGTSSSRSFSWFSDFLQALH